MAGIAAYFVFFPADTFITVTRSDGGSVTFSRGGLELESAPDYFTTNGFEQIQSYVSRLTAVTNGYQFLHIFTPDRMRGFGLSSEEGVVKAGLTVEWRDEAEREKAIRSFFGALGIAPSEDYLAGNGGVPDATRILEYPLTGSATEITALTKRILEDLCGISKNEPLTIKFGD